MPIEIVQVFLDTEAFESQGFNYETTAFKRFQELCRLGQIKLLLTEIVDQEIKAHIGTRAKHYMKKIREIVGESRLLDSIPEISSMNAKRKAHVFVDQLLSKYKDFKTTNGCEIVPTNKIDASKVMHAYFDEKPPFNKGSKKHEFPDAFSLISAYDWLAISEKKGIFVSNDPDIRDIVQTLNLQDRIDVADSIDKLLDHLVKAEELKASLKDLVARSDELILKQLNDHFGDISFIAMEYDADVEDGSFVECTVGDVAFIKATEEYALANVEIQAEMELNVSYGDPSFAYYDDETKEEQFLEWKSSTIQVSVEFEVEVELERPDPAADWQLSVIIKKDSVTFDFDPYDLNDSDG